MYIYLREVRVYPTFNLRSVAVGEDFKAVLVQVALE